MKEKGNIVGSGLVRGEAHGWVKGTGLGKYLFPKSTEDFVVDSANICQAVPITIQGCKSLSMHQSIIIVDWKLYWRSL